VHRNLLVILLINLEVQRTGIPPVAVVLLLGMDRILDMTRTRVNVTGDITACLFFDKKIKSEELSDDNQT